MPKPSLIIRPATRHDLPVIGKLGAQLVHTHHAFDTKRFMMPGGDVSEGYAWFLGSQLSNADAKVLVADERDRVLGYVYAAVEPLSWEELREEAGYIHDVLVDEAARRRGVAVRLIEDAVAWLRERGMPRVLLQTAEQNVSAQRLFARLGFRRTMIEMTREIA